ncbi:hypothetical protein EP331_05435 [bacterium]|nr:MAG: hypothetical protein EP331_05435 [bacterium]
MPVFTGKTIFFSFPNQFISKITHTNVAISLYLYAPIWKIYHTFQIMQTKQTLIKLIESLKDENVINDIFDYAMMLTQIDANTESDNATEVYGEFEDEDEHFDENTSYSIEKLTSMLHRKNGR